jgi:hypothetical protein
MEQASMPKPCDGPDKSTPGTIGGRLAKIKPLLGKPAAASQAPVRPMLVFARLLGYQETKHNANPCAKGTACPNPR